MKARQLLMPLLIGGFATFASASAAAQQCDCKPLDRDNSEKTADIVFWGKAKTNDDGDLVFRVSKSLKGTRRKRKHTVVPADKCNAQLEEDTNYIVFAEKGKKRSIKVTTCMATTPLDHSPYTATAWSAADDLPYGAGKRTIARHQRDRDRLTDRALDKLQYAARKCDGIWKRGKDKATLRFVVRFDVQPNGEYQANILEYAGSPDADSKEQMACLEERLDGKKFRKFSGNPVSVRTYWRIERIDSAFQQEKKSSVVKPYKGPDEPEDDEVAKTKDSKNKGG